MTQRRVENTRVNFWTFSPVSVNPIYKSKKIQYYNVDREFQAAVIQSHEVGGDQYTNYQYWGSDYGKSEQYRDLGDGEKTLGILDWDGRWSRDKKYS